MLSPASTKSQKSLLSDPGSLLSEDEVKEALMGSSYLQNCCYSESLLRDIDILEIRDAPIYRISVEIFSEDRRKQWTTVPYKGEPLSAQVYDPAYADLWSISVPPTVHFGKGKKTVEVPGSTTVVNCAQCNGIGSVQCGQCGGSQTNPCSSCVGYGFGQVLMEDGTAGKSSLQSLIPLIQNHLSRRRLITGLVGWLPATNKTTAAWPLSSCSHFMPSHELFLLESLK